MTHNSIIARRQGPSQGIRSKQCGRGELPPDPGLEALLASTDLSATAKLVAVTLVKHWAWYKPSCYPSNRSIAARCGYSPGHVARCLHELEQGGWIRREQQATGTRLIWLCWRGTPCKDAGGGPATVQGDPPAKARTKPVVSVNERIEPIGSECPERSRPEERQPIAIPPAPPAPPPAAAAEPISTVPGGEKILPPLTALLFPAPVPALPPLVEVGPREARPAIPATLAGPTPQSAPGPVPGGVVAPAEVDPRQSPASPPCALRLARTRSSQSEPPSDHCPSALVAAPDAPRAIPVAPPGPTPLRSLPPLSSPREAGPTLPLTPEQQTRLDALPAATRDLVLTWLLTGDPILVAEARKKLAPLPRRPEAPRTLPEVLGRIREDPSFPALAADWLSSALQDRKSYSGFKARCEEAWRGELPVERLVAAYEQAMGPKVRNRGALWQHCLRQRE
jgi:hypothetical protein